MKQVSWVSIATASPMGQQRYEQEVQAAIRRVTDASWNFTSIKVTSARSRIAGAKRMPARFNTWAPAPISRAAGRVLYGRPALVHRFDLRLPAAWGPEVVTVHDLPPLRFADEGRLTRSAAAGARRARCVIVPSQFAANEIEDLLGIRNTKVIPYGISTEYSSATPASDEALQSLRIQSPFLMHAAGASDRKNLRGLADAWRHLSELHSDLTLVLCGPPDQRRDQLFEGLPRVTQTGRIEASVVAMLMRRAEAVVVPSIYEGFGLPALEGMACGVPVVAANRGALPEVCRDAALLVEPDGEALAAGVDTVLTDVQVAQSLREAGPVRAGSFVWDLAASEHLRVYEEATDRQHGRARH